MEKSNKKGVVRPWYRHPVAIYGAPITTRTIGYGTIGYLIGEGLRYVGREIDESLPKALKEVQTIDDKLGNSMIEQGGKPATKVLELDKKVKDFWSELFGISAEKREENRKNLGLEQPSYMQNETYASTEKEVKPFSYFETKANQISDPILSAFLIYGAIKGAIASTSKYMFNKKVNKLIKEAIIRHKHSGDKQNESQRL